MKKAKGPLAWRMLKTTAIATRHADTPRPEPRPDNEMVTHHHNDLNHTRALSDTLGKQRKKAVVERLLDSRIVRFFFFSLVRWEIPFMSLVGKAHPSV